MSHRSKPTPAGGKKDSKKAVEEEQLIVVLPPSPPPLSPFDVLHEVWALRSLHQQRQRISALFSLPDCPGHCLCFARVALDDTFQHLRFASTLALSPAQARFVHQLISTVVTRMQRTDERPTHNTLRYTAQLLLTTNCTTLLPGTTYIDTTHLLATSELPSSGAPSPIVSDIPSSSTPATSRPTTAAGKRPPPSTRHKPAAPPSPQQQQTKSSKPFTAKEKEAAATAERAAVAAAEVAAAEAAALAALPPTPPTPPPHFLTAEQMERVWRYVVDELLTHADMYAEAYSVKARQRREADRTEYVWRRMKQQPECGWIHQLHEAATEQPVTDRPTAMSGQSVDVFECDLTLPDGSYSAEEREYLIQARTGLKRRLREAAQQQQQQIKDREAEFEEKEQVSGEARVIRVPRTSQLQRVSSDGNQ